MADILDLPAKKNIAPSKTYKNATGKLTEGQVDALVQSAGKAAEDLGEICKGVVGIAGEIVEIFRIKEQAAADVSAVEARTKAVVASVRVEIDRIAAMGKNVSSRGEAAVKVIRELTSAIQMIPEGDDKSRLRLIEEIRPIVSLALEFGSKGA